MAASVLDEIIRNELGPWLSAAQQADPHALRLVAAALDSHAAYLAAAPLVRPQDFSDALLADLWAALGALSNGALDGDALHRIDALAERLPHHRDAHRRLRFLHAEILEPIDATPAGAAWVARHLARSRALEAFRAAIRDVHLAAADSNDRAAAEARAATLGAALHALEQDGDAPTLLEQAASNAELGALSSEEPAAPVVENLLWPAHVNVLAGPSKAGKTFMVCAVLRAIATGTSPWSGTPDCRPGRVLFLSRDDTTAELARRFRLLDPTEASWSSGISVLGKERLPPRLDAAGLEALARAAIRARRDGHPLAGIVLDPLALFLPQGADINRERDVEPVLTGLEALCSEHDLWIWVIHHVRKQPGDARRTQDAGDDHQAIIDTVRGSAAIVQIARAVAVFTKPEAHLRLISPAANHAPARPFTLQVCDPGDHSIRYFRLGDASQHPIARLFGPEEPFSFTDFVRRVEGLDPGEDPGSQAKKRGRAAWDDALRANIIVHTRTVRRKAYYQLAPAVVAALAISDANRPVGRESAAQSADLPGSRPSGGGYYVPPTPETADSAQAHAAADPADCDPFATPGSTTDDDW